MTSSYQFPVPVRSAVKSNLTARFNQNLSNRALNAFTVQTSTNEYALHAGYLFNSSRGVASLKFKLSRIWLVISASFEKNNSFDELNEF